METIKLSEIKNVWEESKKIVISLIHLGYKVYTCNPNPIHNLQPYFFVESKTGGLAYFYQDYLNGLQVTTVHKPCKEYGTGFGFENVKVTSGLIIDVCDGKKPAFACNMHSERYKNFEHYLKYAHNQKYSQVVLE